MRSFTLRGGADHAGNKVKDQKWLGFDRDFSGCELDHVALFTVDGELEVWAIDSPQLVGDLISYLADNEPGVIVPLGCYSRKGAPVTTEPNVRPLTEKGGVANG